MFKLTNQLSILSIYIHFVLLFLFSIRQNQSFCRYLLKLKNVIRK